MSSFSCHKRRLLLAALVSTCASAIADPKIDLREEDVREKMLDILALTKSGVSYSDYSKHLQELVVLYDRYERTGGKNLALQFAKGNLISAQENWDRLLERRRTLTSPAESTSEIRELERKILSGQERMIQADWDAAERQLSMSHEQKAEAATSAKAEGKPAASSTVSRRQSHTK